MKRFLAMLLSFVMLFSLAMPAMAAEPPITGGNSGDVSASFNPGTIEFTGIAVDYEHEYRHNEETNTYTFIIPPDRIGKNVSYDLNLIGTNLDLLDESNELLMVANDSIEDVVPNEIVVNLLKDHGFYPLGRSAPADYSRTYFYSNDGGENWISVSSEVKQSYYVTVSESENGTVTAVEYALPNDIVTLNVSPAENYALDTITVTDASGNPVTVENNQFTMPASAVNVSATFKYAPKYNITLNTSENGSVSADMQTATEGTTVTLTVIPDEGYELDTLTVMNGETEVTVTDNTFVMPAGEVTVSATFKKIPRTITIDNSIITNGSVEADKSTAAEGDTVTLTWTAAEGYMMDKITVTDSNDDEVTVDQGLTSCVFTMPASNVTVTATFKEIPVASASIVWGSMAFTYTDESGWADDGSEGAGTVTVTNTGEPSFNAKATYSAEIDYMNIRGTFDKGVTTLAAGESLSFKLTLHNRPTRILNGQKIGTVTVHISQTDFENVVTVTSEQELLNALADGGAIKFGNDITVSSIDVVEATSDISIDLNGFTFDGIRFDVLENVSVSISGGTIGIRPDNWGGNLTVSDCKLDNYYAICIKGGVTSISDSDIYGTVFVESGTVELDADVTLNASSSGTSGIEVMGGSAVCQFDPSSYVSGNRKVVTDNGDGTWTVTRKQS